MHVIPEPANPADYTDTASVERRMITASEELSEMALALALARQVREYDSDRRKTALSKAVVPFLTQGESAAAAEHKARASAHYGQAMAILAEQSKSAEEVIAKYEAAKIKFECGRSLLSMQKTMAAL